MTLGQGNDTPLGYVKKLCERLSRSNLAVRTYGPDTDFGYVCSVTLGQGHDITHPSVMENNNCVKFIQIGKIGKLWPAQDCEQDTQTDRLIPI